jgi:hypothetical protein
MVDPFALNTDNMTRIEPFTYFIPRRVNFSIKDDVNKGLRTKLVFNEYLYSNEKEELCKGRMKEALG